MENKDTITMTREEAERLATLLRWFDDIGYDVDVELATLNKRLGE